MKYSTRTETGYLKGHVDTCFRKDTRYIEKLLLNHDIFFRSSMIDPIKIR